MAGWVSRVALVVIASLTLARGAAEAVEGDARPAAPRCQGVPATIVGTAAEDRLVGTAGKDVIVGLSGDDRISGLGGADLICGGEGSDRLLGGDGKDRLFGERDGEVTGRVGTHIIGDRLDGGLGDDYLDPGDDSRQGDESGAQEIRFASEDAAVRVDLTTTPATATGQGRDVLVVLPGTKVTGSSGDDVFLGSDAADLVVGRAGNDTADLGGGPDRFEDGPQRGSVAREDDDVVDGGPGRDEIGSRTGSDELMGGLGADRIRAGSESAALLNAGPGRDQVTATLVPRAGGVVDGGAGRDSVHFKRPDERGSGPLGLGAEIPGVVVDVPARTLSVDWEAGEVTMDLRGVEVFDMSRNVRLDFHGSDVAETVTGPFYHPMRAWLGGGDDKATGGGKADQVNGGDGHDVVDGLRGRDTCVAVEVEHSC